MKKELSTLLTNHPCFNPGVKGKYGRVHLPVAPKCNIKCNFCDRKYDCVNESRPGVTSSILTPEQAGIYMDRVLAMEPRITVAGIAGPGDPFANGRETMTTLEIIHNRYPQILLCVSSNGMNIHPYIEELAEMNVSHVTITVCAVDPQIGGKIYSWVRDGNVIYRKQQAAAILLERQLAAIRSLKAHDITVKVNCIVIPTINDHHVVEVAAKMRDLGVDLFNCMAMFPNANTPLAEIGQPDKKTMSALRKEAEEYLPQMRHCSRCRADAVGLLDDDRSEEFRGCLSSCSTASGKCDGKRPYFAVASREGALVNLHLGEAKMLYIWEKKDDSWSLVEKRDTPRQGGGVRRWHQLAHILADCRVVIASEIGNTPREILGSAGIKTVMAGGLLEEALEAVHANRTTAVLKGRRKAAGGGTCSGSGGGCFS